MSRSVKITGILALIIAVAVCVLLHRTDIRIIASFFVGNDGNISYISERNILYTLNHEGRVLMRKSLEDRKGDIEYSYSNLTSDLEGNLYILSEEYNAKEDESISYVQKISPEGKSEGVVFEGGSRSDGRYIFTSQFVGKELLIFVCDEYKQELIANRLDPVTGNVVSKTYGFAVLPSFRWIKASETGSIYYSDHGNRLICLESASTGEYYTEIDLEEQGFSECIPSYISTDAEGNIYFNDICSLRFIRYNESRDRLQQIYGEEDAVTEDMLYRDVVGMRVMNGRAASMANSYLTGNHFFLIQDGDNVYKIDERSLAPGGLIILFISSFIAAFLVLYGLYRILRNFYRTKSIMLKQGFIMSVVLIIAVVFLSYIIRYAVLTNMLDETNYQLYSLAGNLASYIDADDIGDIQLPMDNGDRYYVTSAEDFQIYGDEFFDIFPEAPERRIYYNIYSYQNENFYLIISADSEGFGQMNGVNEYYSGSNSVVKQTGTSEDGTVSFYESEAEAGMHRYCRVDLYDSYGNLTGKVEVGIEYTSYAQVLGSMLNIYTVIIVVINLMVMSVLIIMVRRTLNGLKKLSQGVDELMDGNYDVKVHIKSRDELGEIGDAFNEMTEKVKSYMDSIQLLNTAYERFVPEETLGIMGKRSIMEVNRGDNVINNMAVIMINTSNFSSISESFSGAETFGYFNRFYRNITQLVKSYGGVTEDYRGAGMRCVFEGKTDYCVDCGLEILEKSENDPDGAELNIIVQRGDIMFGIVGSSENYEAVAASDILNCTYVLQGIADKNGIKLMVTSEAYEKIENKEKYNFRYIGKTKIRQITNIVQDLYEVLDAYPQKERQFKLQAISHFDRGVQLFQEGNLREAEKYFADVIRIDRQDKMARMYLFLCDEFMDRMPESWEGYFE